MNTMGRNTRIALAACLAVVVPLLVSAEKSETSTSCETATAGAVACETRCSITETASNPACETSCVAATNSPVCGVSGTSCGTLVTVDFDPALNAETGSSAVIAEDLGLQTLDEFIEPLRAKYRVPALAVAVARSDGVFAVGTVGVRVAGAASRVTPTDRFHLGSCGKSITASVAARMVERGQITWRTTIGEVFGDVAEAAHSAYRDVTLEQLLAHRSGFPARDAAVMRRIWALAGDTPAQRGGFVRMALELKPGAEPGSTFLYSDVGYTIAGVMLERAAGKSWEELVEEHVATPLRLTSLGFGEPASPGHFDQPWGHIADGTRTVPFSPGPYAELDNPAVIGPAGLVHLSIIDWGTYASDHLRGARGQNSVMLSPAAYRVMHANVEGQDYGLGWGVSQNQLGRALTHTGSCGEWYSVVNILPDIDLAIVAATNVSGGNGVAACNDALVAALDRFAVKPLGAAAGSGP